MKLTKYNSYKDLDITWLGVIPKHWEVKRNKSIFFETSQLSKSGKETLLTVSHITGVTPRSEKNVNMFFAETMEGYKICRKGDLIINTMWAWMGALGTSKYYGICSPAYNVYRNTKGIDYNPDYFEYLFRIPSSIVEMTRHSKGIVSSRLRLYPKDFFQILSPVPPLEEQKSIALFLNQKTTAIDKKISLLENKIKCYKELSKSLINETVCRGLKNGVPLKESGIEWIGKMPKHWEIGRFKSFAKAIKGKAYDFYDSPVEGSLPSLSLDYLRNENTSFTSYCICSDKGQLVSEKDYVIVWDGAGVGEILRGKKGVLSSTIAKLVFEKRKLIPDYFYFLRHSLEYTLKSIPTGMGIPHLNPQILNNFSFTIPPMKEQIAIADYLDNRTKIFESIITNITGQLEGLRELRKTLINDVVTGKLKVAE